MADKRRTRRGGFYWHKDRPLVSVTNVLKIIDKPALRYWFGQQVYWAMVKNPDLGEKEALNSPWKTSGKAKSRGTAVHNIVETWKTTGDLVTDAPEDYKGYARGFEKWVNEYNAKVLEHEKTVINLKEKYAGTLDLLTEINNTRAIIDVKTGKDIYPEAGLQLSAYLHGENVEAERIGVLLLQESGKYKFQWVDDDYEVFLHAKALWEWNNQSTLNSVNYYQQEALWQ